MTTSKHWNDLRLAAGAAGCALVLTACGADATTTEPIEVVQAEFSAAACAEATADLVLSNQIDPAVVSPQSYDTCDDGYVVDVRDLSPAYTGGGNVMDARIAIQYADLPITRQSTCEASKIDGIFYVEDFGFVSTSASGDGVMNTTGGWAPFWAHIKTETKYGTWNPSFGGSCAFEINLMGLVPGASYRIAATARRPRLPTRKVSIGTYRPINIQ